MFKVDAEYDATLEEDGLAVDTLSCTLAIKDRCSRSLRLGGNYPQFAMAFLFLTTVLQISAMAEVAICP
jgi:hypothetical protein